MMTIFKKALLLGLVLTLAMISTAAAEQNAPTLTERIDMLERSLDAMQRKLGGTDMTVTPAETDPIEPVVVPSGDAGVTENVSDTVHAMKEVVMAKEGVFTFTRAVVKDGLLLLTFSYKNTTESRHTISDLDFTVKDADGKKLVQSWECDFPWFDGTAQPDGELTGDICFMFSKSSSYTIDYDPFDGTMLTWMLTN